MADKKQRTPERQKQVESRASRMESTRNARNWDNPEANLTKGQRVRGMARASVADAIGEKFGILGQKASDKIKGKTGPTLGQMAKNAGKEAIAEKFGPLGKIATMGKDQKKNSTAEKVKTDSATEKDSKQLSDIKSSNASNANMLRTMKGSLRSIDQKLEDILFSQERMENMLNRMLMDRKAPAVAEDTGGPSFMPAQGMGDEEGGNGGDGPNIDINRKGRSTRGTRGGGRPSVRGAPRGGGFLRGAGRFLGSAGRFALGTGARMAAMAAAPAAAPLALGAAAVGGLGYLAYRTGKARRENPEGAQEFDNKMNFGAARSQVIQGPEAEQEKFKDKPLPDKKLTPPELLKKFGLTKDDVAGIKGNIINLKDGRQIDTVQQNFVDVKDAAMAQSAIDQKTSPVPTERFDTGADSRDAEVVMQDATISSKDPREHLIAAVKSGKIKDFSSFMQGLRTAVTSAGIKDNIDIEISKLRFWVWKKVAEANGGSFTGSGPEYIEAFIKIYGGTPDMKALEADKSNIEEWKKSQAGEPETGKAPEPPPSNIEQPPAQQPPQAAAGGEGGTSTGAGTTTPGGAGAGTGGTPSGPPSAVTPSAGGDKGGTAARGGSEQSLLTAAKAAGINDATELAQFMAQMAHESGDFRYLQEIWGPTSAQKGYEGRKDLGNTQPGDGYKFRGRGYVQLTGRANYRAFGGMIGADLENNPDLASQPDIAAKLAVAYWRTRVKSRVRDFENTRAVTKLINGGFNGLADREAKFKKYKEQKDLAGGAGATGGAGTAGVDQMGNVTGAPAATPSGGSVATPGAEGGGAATGGSPTPAGGSPAGGGMPGVDQMGSVTGAPGAAPGGAPSGGAAGGPPALAPPGSGGPAVEGAGTAAGDKTGQNGMLSPDRLASVGIGSHKAQPVAADAFKAMKAAATNDKVDLGITDSYRSYAAQVDVKRRKPGLAATPGKSNHGWGLAFDMSFGSNQKSPGYQWMVQNASKFGFKGPLQKPFEPWHWEYVGGGSKDAMASAGAGGQGAAGGAAAGAEGGGSSAPPSSGAGSAAPGIGGAGGSEGAGAGGTMASASPAAGGSGAGPCPPSENTAKPATTPVETGADLNRRSADAELSKSSTGPNITVAGGQGEPQGGTVPNAGGRQEGMSLTAVPMGGFAEQLASGVSGSLVESTGSNSMSMNRRAAGGSMVA
jgi:putative chitinase